MKATKEGNGATASTSTRGTTEIAAALAVPPTPVASVYGRFALLALPGTGSETMLDVSGVELEMANRGLRRRVSELEAENEALEVFAHAVAHDLKAPVCHLAGYADLLQSTHADLSKEELQECLERIQCSALRLSDMIDGLLLLAGLCQEETGIEELDMADIVSRALSRLAYRVADDATEIVLPETWPAAAGYAPWIEEVWVNYVDNALKYGGCPGRVELGAERMNGKSRFWVRDNGRGLTAEEQGRLFRPFVRIDQAHTQGHGLGLSIVRYIVERLGGQVGVESSGVPGQGSLFSFTLPAERRSESA